MVKLSKKNAAKIEGWEFVLSERISEYPHYITLLYCQRNHYMAIVVKWPTHSTKQNPMVPVVYETGVSESKDKILKLCREACT